MPSSQQELRHIGTCNNLSNTPKGGNCESNTRLGRHKENTRELLASGGWLENLSDLRHESLVWRPCWISGGYRLEAASRPIALYIVGIREAQGRNQHFYVWYRNIGRANSGWRWRTVLADSDGLAIAPQDTIHLPDHGTSPQCMFNAKPEIMAMRSLLSAVQLRSCATIIRLRSSNLLQYMRHSLCIYPSNVTDMAPKSNACKLSIWRRPQRCINCPAVASAADVG